MSSAPADTTGMSIRSGFIICNGLIGVQSLKDKIPPVDDTGACTATGDASDTKLMIAFLTKLSNSVDSTSLCQASAVKADIAEFVEDQLQVMHRTETVLEKMLTTINGT